MTRVLVTPRSMSAGGNPAVRRLEQAGIEVVCPSPGRQPARDELLAALPGVEVWIAGVERIDGELMDAAPDLRAICRNGAGVDAIDADAAERRGIRIVPARGANARGVAELALGLVIAGFRGLVPAATALKRGDWHRSTGRELAGSTLGVVGYGAIGRTLGTLASGCGMRVIGYDPYLTETGARAGTGDLAALDALVGLDELLAEAHAVSLHLPPLPGGALIGAPELARMRAGAMLVNTARSGLVDAAAALAALERGHLGGYAVDAFDVEPPPVDQLLAHPRVIASPHLGAATAESIERASAAAVEHALAILAEPGAEPETVAAQSSR